MASTNRGHFRITNVTAQTQYVGPLTLVVGETQTVSNPSDETINAMVTMTMAGQIECQRVGTFPTPIPSVLEADMARHEAKLKANRERWRSTIPGVLEDTTWPDED